MKLVSALKWWRLLSNALATGLPEEAMSYFWWIICSWKCEQRLNVRKSNNGISCYKGNSCSTITSKLLDWIFKDIFSILHMFFSLILFLHLAEVKGIIKLRIKRYYFGQGQVFSICISFLWVYETYIPLLLILALLYFNFTLI